MFCLFNTTTNEIAAKWDRVPSSLVLPNGDQIEGASAGFQAGEWIIAPYAYVDEAPSRFHVAGAEVASFQDGVVNISREWEPVSLANAKAAASDQIGRWRFEQETAGFDMGGMHVSTDRESQSKIIAAWASAKLDPTYTVPNWKLGPFTFVTLDNATVIMIGDAARAHVQASFNAEQEKSGAVDAATTIEEVATVLASIEV